MNTIEHYVTEVIGQPYTMYGKWWTDVMADSYGRIDKHFIMFQTEDGAKLVGVGYRFDA